MKKIMSLIIAVSIFAVAFVGCGSGMKADSGTKNYTTNGKETKLVPDETATGELTVSCYGQDYMGDVGGDTLTVAENLFRELYPNVNLKVERVTRTSNINDYIGYSKKLATQVMAGNAPDLFWIASGFDIPKMIKAGTFANMFEYFENDKNFNISDYNQGAFCGGQPDGTQFVIPITYYIPLMQSTESMIGKIGFNISKSKDHVSFFQELDKVASKDTKLTSLINGNIFIQMYPCFSGFDWIDYENSTINLENDKMKKTFELLKKNFQAELVKNAFIPTKAVDAVDGIVKKESLFIDYTSKGMVQAVRDMQLLLYKGEKPIQLAVGNDTGKINAFTLEYTAVSRDSKNKQNAYYFLKTLLSPKAQERNCNEMNFIPISNEATKSILKDISSETEIYYGGEIGNIVIPELPQEYIDKYIALLNEVEKINYATKGMDILKANMMPYYKGEKPYEECIKNAQSALEIYVSE